MRGNNVHSFEAICGYINYYYEQGYTYAYGDNISQYTKEKGYKTAKAHASVHPSVHEIVSKF